MNILIMFLSLSTLVAPGCTTAGDGTVKLTIKINYVKPGTTDEETLRCTGTSSTNERQLDLELTIALTELNPAILPDIWSWATSMYITIPKENNWNEICLTGNKIVTDTDKDNIKIPYQIKNTSRHFRAKVDVDKKSLDVDLSECCGYGSGYDTTDGRPYVDVDMVHPKVNHPRSIATKWAQVGRDYATDQWENPSTVGFVQITKTRLVVTAIKAIGESSTTVAEFKNQVHFEQFQYLRISSVRVAAEDEMVRVLYCIVENRKVTVKLTFSDITIFTVGFKQEEKGWMGFLTGGNETLRLYGKQLVQTDYEKENFEKLLCNEKCVIEMSDKIEEPGKPVTWTKIKAKCVKDKADNGVRIIAVQYDLAQQ